MKKNKVVINRNLFIIWMIFLLLNIVVAVQLKVLTILPDELNTLGISAYLSGSDWSAIISNYKNYYGYGQAILYTPLFILIKDNIILYKAIIIVNSILVSFIPVIAYKLLYEYFSFPNNKSTFVIACVIGAQPCYLALSKRAWNESLILLLLWCVCLLLLKCYESDDHTIEKNINSILLAITLIYGYVTHGRFIAIIGAVIIISIYQHYISKKRVIEYIPFSVTFCLLYYINNLIKLFLLRKIWLINSENELRNTLSETIHRIFDNIFSMDTFYVYLRAFSGYIFYLFVASLGLIILGTVLLITRVKRSGKKGLSDLTVFFGVFCLVLVVFSIGVAVLFFTTELLNPPEYYYIYGRYTEYIIGPFLLLTFVLIKEVGTNLKSVIVSGSILIVVCLYTFIAEAPTLTSGQLPVVDLNILTLNSFSYNYGVEKSKLAFFSAILFSIICFIIISVMLLKKKYVLCYIAILSIFLFSYFQTASKVLIKASDREYKAIEKSYKFFKHITLNDIEKKLYFYNLNPHSYQLALRDYAFQPINENLIPDINSFIITQANFHINCDYNELYKVVSNDAMSIDTIMVYGDDLANDLIRQGVKLEQKSYSIGDTLKFSSTDIENRYIKKGWSTAEDWGMWSEGNESELNISLKEPLKKDIKIALEASAFNAGKNIDIYINGNYLTSSFFSNTKEYYYFSVPRNMLNRDSLDIVFMIKDLLVSPKEVGLNEDPRKLGFGLYSIKVYYLE